MVASQNLRGNRKRLAIDDNKVPKKAIKKVQPKRASFGNMSQTSVSSQGIGESSFAILAIQSLNIVTLSRILSKKSEFSCFHI